MTLFRFLPVILASILYFSSCEPKDDDNQNIILEDTSSNIQVDDTSDIKNDTSNINLPADTNTVIKDDTNTIIKDDTNIVIIDTTINNTGSKTSNIIVYFSESNDYKISQYILDTIAGSLKFTKNYTVSGKPGCITIDNKKEYMYVALRSNNSVATFKIDTSGNLNHVKTTLVGENPVYISIDKNRKFLFLASFGDNKIAVFPINNDATVNSTYIQNITVGDNPHMILPDPSGNYVLASSMGTDQILQYKLENNGSLSSNTPSSATSSAESGPRHFIFHPTENIFYNVNQLNGSVNVYDYSTATGTLSFAQNISTLPSGYSETNSCADIHITPNGKYLYASNRGHNSIAAFLVNQQTGKLTTIGQYSTEDSPREFDIDPTGNYLIAAGQSSDKTAIHKIKSDGSLEITNTYSIGESPAWVLAVRF